jgi:hypothetical protein
MTTPQDSTAQQMKIFALENVAKHHLAYKSSGIDERGIKTVPNKHRNIIRLVKYHFVDLINIKNNTMQN